MVAIAVVLILVGILMYSFSAISNSTKERETRGALEIAKGMLAELDAKTKLGLKNAPTEWWTGNGTSITAAQAKTKDDDIDFWRMPDKNGTFPPPVRGPGNIKDGENDRTNHYVLLNTALAMSKLMAMPENRKKIEALPAQRVMQVAGNPILLDGWGNPIIFVPASGLYDVAIEDATDVVLVTSSKVRTGPPSDYAAMGVDRPFFASAGPDGVFGFVDKNGNGTYQSNSDVPGGEDNIYSFEQ